MISIIIPTFGDFVRVNKLLTSIRRFEKEPFEAIVINDNPRKGVAPLPYNIKYKLIQNQKNLGFAASVNKGLAVATGDILLLLNDDIVFNQAVFKEIKREFLDHTLGVLGATLFYPSKAVQHAGMKFDHKGKSFYHIKSVPKKSSYVLAVTGAFFAISRELYSLQGGLDEKYFLACEDTKYCLDAWKRGFLVKLSHQIKAIHEEGATRGRTIQEKLKHKVWTAAEIAGIKAFKSSLDVSYIKQLEGTLRTLNKEPLLKIEVGSGYNPHPGYLHLDVRKGLPQLDYVCDFVAEKLPFKDNEVEEILANHVIEHIPYRKLPFVIGEWVRVLKDGGKLVLRTPNLRFICEKYLRGETTPEWPGDEKFIKENLSEEMTPAWWANLKLFSGQDYAANFHHVCFDFDMLSGILLRCGFGSALDAKFDKEFSPGELQIEAYKGDYKDDPKLKQEINFKKRSCCVIRDGAMGDVILTTPIIERLAKEYIDITVFTNIAEVFNRNPYVRSVFHGRSGGTYDTVIDLNLAYEKNPKMHIIDAYSLVAFGDTDTPHVCKLYEEKKPKEDYIVIHAGRSWENRTWSQKNWLELQNKFGKSHVILVGGKGDWYYNGNDLTWLDGSSKNLVGRQSFWELVETIQKAKLFVGMDSGPLHIAQAVGTEAIGLFTCAKAEYRTTGNLRVISPDIDCYGCLHDVKPPVTYCGCRRGDFKCLDLITPEMVYEKIKQYV